MIKIVLFIGNAKEILHYALFEVPKVIKYFQNFPEKLLRHSLFINSEKNNRSPG